MAKKKRRSAKKPAAKKSVKKPAKKAAGKAVLVRSGDAPGQKTLKGFEEKRVTAVERCIKNILAQDQNRRDATAKADSERTRLPALYKKHKLKQYSYSGVKVTIDPGSETVAIKKVKKQ